MEEMEKMEIQLKELIKLKTLHILLALREMQLLDLNTLILKILKKLQLKLEQHY